MVACGKINSYHISLAPVWKTNLIDIELFTSFHRSTVLLQSPVIFMTVQHFNKKSHGTRQAQAHDSSIVTNKVQCTFGIHHLSTFIGNKTQQLESLQSNSPVKKSRLKEVSIFVHKEKETMPFYLQ